MLRHCPISGCQCHKHGIPPDQVIPARLQRADLVSVVDLFDNARIDELLSLGQYRNTYRVRGGQSFSPFQWLQWRWKNRGRDEVLLQWVALLASRAGKLTPNNLPDLDDPDSWVTWEGVNKKNQWVKGVMRTMPELKPVVRVRLVTRHFSENCAHYESYFAGGGI